MRSLLGSGTLVAVTCTGRKAGRIKAGGKWRPVSGTKEFQGPGWKWIPIRLATPACPSSPPPPLAPAGQPPSPWCFVVLPWFFKSFLKAPGLTPQQHVGQFDSTANPTFDYHTCIHALTYFV